MFINLNTPKKIASSCSNPGQYLAIFLKILYNKLGQRQNKTPISSAFWIQKDFRLKKVLGPKNLVPKIFWVQKKFGVKKNFWVQKKVLVLNNLGFKKILGAKRFWVKKILGPKIFVFCEKF